MFFVVCQSSLPSQKFATFHNERIIFAVVFEEFLVSMVDSNDSIGDIWQQNLEIDFLLEWL